MGQNAVLTFFSLLAIFSVRFQVKATADIAEHSDKDEIQDFQVVLQTRVREDILSLQEKFNDLVEEVNATLDGLQNFTEQSIAELREHTFVNMEKRDKNLDDNIRKLEDYAGIKIEDLNGTMKENFENLNEISKSERSSIIDWIHQRSHQHEDLLKSEIGLCVFDKGHRGVGRVKYNSKDGGYIDGHTKWRVFNVTRPDNCCPGDDTVYCEDCAMKVLNRRTGIFTVPPNAAGLYMFTFSATMDTYQGKNRFSPNEYMFEKNEELLDETGLYADAGSNWKNDKVPGSRTIFLRLEDGDKVSVRQTRAKYVLDHHISFCGALVHLKKASESPGMSVSNHRRPRRAAVESQDQSGSFGPPLINQPGMKSDVEYNFPGFEALPPVSNFEYSTKDLAEGALMVPSNVLIGKLFGDYCESYRSKTSNEDNPELCATLDGFRDFWPKAEPEADEEEGNEEKGNEEEGNEEEGDDEEGNVEEGDEEEGSGKEGDEEEGDEEEGDEEEGDVEEGNEEEGNEEEEIEEEGNEEEGNKEEGNEEEGNEEEGNVEEGDDEEGDVDEDDVEEGNVEEGNVEEGNEEEGNEEEGDKEEGNEEEGDDEEGNKEEGNEEEGNEDEGDDEEGNKEEGNEEEGNEEEGDVEEGNEED